MQSLTNYCVLVLCQHEPLSLRVVNNQSTTKSILQASFHRCKDILSDIGKA